MDIYKIENWLTEDDVRKEYGQKHLNFLRDTAQTERDLHVEKGLRFKFPTGIKTPYGWIFEPSICKDVADDMSVVFKR